jgi:putative NADH-flavin reductase
METQKIVLFGATTKVGQRILNEALARGHKVTAIVREPDKITTTHSNLKVVAGDVLNFNKNDVTTHLRGQDAVISAYEPKASPQDHFNSTRALIEGVKGTEVKHLVAFGHPGSEETEPGITLPANDEGWKTLAQAQHNVIETLKKEKNFQWGYAHYPELENSAGKSGKPSLGSEMTLVTNEGSRKFAAKNSAENTLDEIEHQMHEQTEL